MDFETLDAEQAINKISNIVDQSHDPAHKFKMLEALRDKALRTAQNSEGEVSQEAQRAIVILERMMQEAQEEQAESDRIIRMALIDAPRAMRTAENFLRDTTNQVQPLIDEADTLTDSVNSSVRRKFRTTGLEFNRTAKDMTEAIAVY